MQKKVASKIQNAQKPCDTSNSYKAVYVLPCNTDKTTVLNIWLQCYADPL